METKKCACERCGQARWSSSQNRSTRKRCCIVFELQWRSDLGRRTTTSRGSIMESFEKPGFGDRRRPRRFGQIVGNSPCLEAVLGQVERVAVTDSTVLVLGETGTGKELIARAIHNISPRCGRPFINLNCAAIPSDLLESELFGHEKGAFTGAVAQRIGRFELADAGTLFLDEVG